MNILITGNQGLAKALGELLSAEHSVTYVSRSTGHDITNIQQWAPNFYHYDMCVNSAYHSWNQVEVLEQFFWAWHQDSSKHIVNIGSTISDYARTETDKEHEYMNYRVHKQALQLAFGKLVKQAQCSIKLINPGAMDTNMLKHLDFPNKMQPEFVAQKIISVLFDSCIKRIDLWQ
jgi:NAD(P)-dependent dehydrogenase (short-subunit alcohol dehydrogenase family)